MGGRFSDDEVAHMVVAACQLAFTSGYNMGTHEAARGEHAATADEYWDLAAEDVIAHAIKLYAKMRLQVKK